MINSCPGNVLCNSLLLLFFIEFKKKIIFYRSGVQPRRGSDKEIQELIKSYIRVPISNSEIVPNNKLDYVTRHKVPISKDAPLELFDSENIMHFQSQGDTKQPQFINDLNKPNCKIENFTQTAWSNLLVCNTYIIEL